MTPRQATPFNRQRTLKTALCTVLLLALSLAIIVPAEPAFADTWSLSAKPNSTSARVTTAFQSVVIGTANGANAKSFYIDNVEVANTYPTTTPLTLTQLAQNALNGDIVSWEHSTTDVYYTCIVPQTSMFPMPYCWDSAFSSLGALTYNATLAKDNINAEFSTQETSGVYNGMLPNAPSTTADTDLRSQPPIIAYACWQYYQATGDSASLAAWYPKLQAYFTWYNTYSDIQRNNLYAPLSGVSSGNVANASELCCASTGMDNSPVYDSVVGSVIQKSNGFYYLPMNDLLLSSSMALFAKDMVFISNALGYPSNAISYGYSYVAISNAINANLWNSTEGRYNSQLWTGQQIQVNTVQTFMPMVAGVASPIQAADLIANLENTAEYNLAYGIPTVAANDPTFGSTPPSGEVNYNNGYYWRGGIWAPTTYLVCMGLSNYGYTSLINAITTTWDNLAQSEVTYPFPEYYSTSGTYGDTNPDQSWTSAVTLLLLEGMPASQPAQIPITVASIPTAGTGFITFNGTLESTPCTALCGVGNSENIAAISPANVVSGQSQYVWQSWNDSGAQSHSIIVSTSTSTYTATFQLQYYLTVSSSEGTTSGSGWYNSGAVAYAGLTSETVAGSTGVQYVFASWSLDDGTNYASDAVTMNNPITETASWTTQYYLTINSAYGTPSGSGWYNAGADITFSVSSTVPESIIMQHVCTGWTGTGSAPATGTNANLHFRISQPSSITWNWQSQFVWPMILLLIGATSAAVIIGLSIYLLRHSQKFRKRK